MALNKTNVALDTNFLLLHGRRNVDVLGLLPKSGLEPVILAPVVAELTRLATGRSETAVHARLALSLIKRKGLKITPSSVEYADSAILAYCKAHKAAAATQDAALRRALRSARIPVVTFHRSGKLVTEEIDVLQAQSPRPHPRTARPVR